MGKGHHQARVSLPERQSRLSLIAQVPRRGADPVAKAVMALLEPLQLPIGTLTSDNGKEFAQHETLDQALKESELIAEVRQSRGFQMIVLILSFSLKFFLQCLIPILNNR